MTSKPLSALLALVAMASTVSAQAMDQGQDPGAALDAKGPLGLAGVEALVGLPMSSLATAPLVCGEPAPDGAKVCRVARRYGDYLIDSPPPLTDKVEAEATDAVRPRSEHRGGGAGNLARQFPCAPGLAQGAPWTARLVAQRACPVCSRRGAATDDDLAGGRAAGEPHRSHAVRGAVGSGHGRPRPSQTASDVSPATP